MLMRYFYALCCALISMPLMSHAQFTVNNNATVISASSSSNCFQLTPADFYQRGSVWNTVAVNLSTSFTVNAKMFFGASDNGADGIAFVLQNEGTSYQGNVGAGLGYHRFNGT